MIFPREFLGELLRGRQALDDPERIRELTWQSYFRTT